MLKLYYSPGSCALASHICLEEACAHYVAERLNFANSDQQKPEYLAINPKGRVPALITDRGILTETPAILLFIAQSFPDAKLAPLDDTFALAELQAFNNYLCSTVHVAHAHGRRAARWADDEAAIAAMQRKMPQNMAECFELIERDMFKGPWVMGDTYTIADPYLFTIANWLKGDSVDINRFPTVREHSARMSARAAVERVMAQHRAAAA